MIRYLLRWMFLLSGLFILPVLLIRAQPYDDSDLCAFLTPPEGCPAPCFMGIRPGVTTTEEAIAILEAHAWVESVGIYDDLSNINWEWIDSAPRWIDKIGVGSLHYEQNVVTSLIFRIGFKMGDALLILGQPDGVYTRTYPLEGVGGVEWNIEYSAWYIDYGLSVVAVGTCPVHKFDLWIMWVSYADLQGTQNFGTTGDSCPK